MKKGLKILAIIVGYIVASVLCGAMIGLFNAMEYIGDEATIILAAVCTWGFRIGGLIILIKTIAKPAKA